MLGHSFIFSIVSHFLYVHSACWWEFQGLQIGRSSVISENSLCRIFGMCLNVHTLGLRRQSLLPDELLGASYAGRAGCFVECHWFGECKAPCEEVVVLEALHR